MAATPDHSRGPVLEAFGVRPDALLGFGGEARVYALDDERVLRISHGPVDPDAATRRQRLVTELGAGQPGFRLPEVLEQGESAGWPYTIERRLPGSPVSELLATAEGAERRMLIEHHLEAAAALGCLPLEPRGWFGELLTEPPLRTPTWRQYLVERAARSLSASTPEFHGIDPAPLAEALPDAAAPAFVHLDAFAGNMLAIGTQITAVIDFGPTCVVGDARLDPLATAVYLLSPQITPAGRPGDADVVASWLRSADLAEWFEPTRRWLAAFWAFAVDDPQLHRWCRSVLLDP